MKTRILASIVLLGLVLAKTRVAQEQKASENGYRIQVGIEEVLVDAVVLDSKGRQVVDLTAADFEIYQDHKLQKINSCTYVDGPPKREIPVASPTESSPSEMLISKPKPSRDKIQRTIAFLINGAGVDPRPRLRTFVESQMKPGDMVAAAPGHLLRWRSSTMSPHCLRRTALHLPRRRSQRGIS
jgi:hypothetical protein